MREEVLTCVQCGNPFIFGEGEKARHLARGFDRPRRCTDCRKNKARSPRMDQEHKQWKKLKHNWRRIKHAFSD